MNQLEQNLKNMKGPYGYRPLYRLRYRLDYAGRPSFVGQWDSPIKDPMSQVWAKNKEGLVRVAIEGEKQHYWTTHTLLEVDGHDYVSMRWVSCLPLGGWSHGTVTRQGKPVGLTVMTRSKAATVFVDGTGDLKDLNDYEKQWKLKEHSI